MIAWSEPQLVTYVVKLHSSYMATKAKFTGMPSEQIKWSWVIAMEEIKDALVTLANSQPGHTAEMTMWSFDISQIEGEGKPFEAVGAFFLLYCLWKEAMVDKHRFDISLDRVDIEIFTTEETFYG